MYTSGKRAQSLTISGYDWEGEGGGRREQEGGRGRQGQGREEVGGGSTSMPNRWEVFRK